MRTPRDHRLGAALTGSEASMKTQPSVLAITATPALLWAVLASCSSSAARPHGDASAPRSRSVSPATSPCSPQSRSAVRTSFDRLYRAKRYAEARPVIEEFLQRCASETPAIDRARMLSDLALAHHRAGNSAACLQTLAAAPKLAGERSDEQKVLAALEYNRTLCAKSSGAPPDAGALVAEVCVNPDLLIDALPTTDGPDYLTLIYKGRARSEVSAQVLERPDLNGDGRPDILAFLALGGDEENRFYGAFVACGPQKYRPVLDEYLASGIRSSKLRRDGWLLINAVVREPSDVKRTLAFDGREYVEVPTATRGRP
jgi:hypothetical protein